MAGNAMACATVLHWQGKKSAAAGLIRRIRSFSASSASKPAHITVI
jgi:hypothetical protein